MIRTHNFQIHLIRKVLGMKWQDKARNLKVIAKSNHKCEDAIIGMKKLNRLGHNERTDDQCIPKSLSYSGSETRKRKLGGTKLRYMDQIKSD